MLMENFWKCAQSFRSVTNLRSLPLQNLTDFLLITHRTRATILLYFQAEQANAAIIRKSHEERVSFEHCKKSNLRGPQKPTDCKIGPNSWTPFLN